jgi:hypothetical protein
VLTHPYVFQNLLRQVGPLDRMIWCIRPHDLMVLSAWFGSFVPIKNSSKGVKCRVREPEWREDHPSGHFWALKKRNSKKSCIAYKAAIWHEKAYNYSSRIFNNPSAPQPYSAENQ